MVTYERSSNEILEKFDSVLNSDDCNFTGKIVDHHVIIDIPKNESHFWSPQLHFEVDEIEGKKTEIRGLFGPKPQVWTLFILVHFIVATAFIGFGILLYVNVKFDKSIVLPVTILGILPIVWVVLYFLGRLGKEKGKEQMDNLKTFMRSILKQMD